MQNLTPEEIHNAKTISYIEYQALASGRVMNASK
jgi:hypothetical protein